MEWNAVMYAIYFGQFKVAEALVEKGKEKSVRELIENKIFTKKA